MMKTTILASKTVTQQDENKTAFLLQCFWTKMGKNVVDISDVIIIIYNTANKLLAHKILRDEEGYKIFIPTLYTNSMGWLNEFQQKFV